MDLPATLFPHTFFPESAVKKVLSFFGPLTLYQAWYMEPPEFVSESSSPKSLQLLTPPDTLRPNDGFMARLAECNAWIEENRDKGYTAFLQATGESEVHEEKSWEIRKALRERSESSNLTKFDKTHQWHLILHLAKELESQQYEAEGLLRDLKQEGALLEGALENDEELESVLRDLPQFRLDADTWERHLDQIFETWFSLFGSQLNNHAFLVTWDHKVMNHASNLFDEDGENTSLYGFSRKFQWPDLSQHDISDLILKKEKISEREKPRELRKYLLALLQDSESRLSQSGELGDRFENIFSEDMMRHPLDIEVRYFPKQSNRVIPGEKKVLHYLSGKTLILVD